MFVTNCRKIKTDCRSEKEAVAYTCMVMESDEWQRREIGSGVHLHGDGIR